jgi:hypothetical protein
MDGWMNWDTHAQTNIYRTWLCWKTGTGAAGIGEHHFCSSNTFSQSQALLSPHKTQAKSGGHFGWTMSAMYNHVAFATQWKESLNSEALAARMTNGKSLPIAQFYASIIKCCDGKCPYKSHKWSFGLEHHQFNEWFSIAFIAGSSQPRSARSISILAWRRLLGSLTDLKKTVIFERKPFCYQMVPSGDSWFTKKRWFSIVMLVYQMVSHFSWHGPWLAASIEYQMYQFQTKRRDFTGW